MRDEVLGGGASGVLLGRRLAVVDALRAVAALLVLFGHTDLGAYHGRPWWPLVEPVWINGGTGVGLFLVLSGFSIHLRWAARDDEGEVFPVRRFWQRRFLRLYPTYWLALGVCLGLLVLAEGPAVLSRSRPWFWGGSQPIVVAGFTHVVVITANLVPATFIVRAWSLALEEQIYAGYAFVQRRLRSISSSNLLVGAFVVSMVFQAIVQVSTDWVPLAALRASTPAPAWEVAVFFQLPTRAFEWLLGMVVAEWWVGRRSLPLVRSGSLVPLAVVCAISAAGGLWFRFHSPALDVAGRSLHPTDALVNGLFALGFVTLLMGLLQREERLRAGVFTGRVLRFSAAVGLFSYSLYLLHPPVLEVIARRVPVTGAVSIVVQWTGALLVSWVFFLIVERHFIARAGRIGRAPAARLKAAV